MDVKFFDAHTHVNLAAFKDDYRETVNRALAAGAGMVNVGTQKDTSLRAVEIAREFRDMPVFAAVGLHPIHTGKSFHDTEELGNGEAAKAFNGRGEIFDYEYYKKLALDSKVIALGECGLDYFRVENKEAKEKQKTAFLEQIKLAHEVKKPLMIHCRAAFPDLIDILSANINSLNVVPGIIHFMSGTKDEAKKLLDLGFYFTFGGVITFVRDYDEIIKLIPLDRILSETDAPYVAPTPYRGLPGQGKRNEPAYVIEVVKKLAEIKNMSLDEISPQILKNTAICFNLEVNQ
ncbi:MAG: TatD family hydrolase [Minisyncoccia bacterium]